MRLLHSSDTVLQSRPHQPCNTPSPSATYPNSTATACGELELAEWSVWQHFNLIKNLIASRVNISPATYIHISYPKPPMHTLPFIVPLDCTLSNLLSASTSLRAQPSFVQLVYSIAQLATTFACSSAFFLLLVRVCACLCTPLRVCVSVCMRVCLWPTNAFH